MSELTSSCTPDIQFRNGLLEFCNIEPNGGSSSKRDLLDSLHRGGAVGAFSFITSATQPHPDWTISTLSRLSAQPLFGWARGSRYFSRPIHPKLLPTTGKNRQLTNVRHGASSARHVLDVLLNKRDQETRPQNLCRSVVIVVGLLRHRRWVPRARSQRPSQLMIVAGGS